MAMSKDQKQMIMVGVLLVVLVLVFMNNLKPKKKKGSAPAAPAEAGQAPVAQPAAAGQAKKSDAQSEAGQKERMAMMGWGRDPFLPYEDQPAAGTGFTLQGISIGKGRKGYALINNEIVKAGDSFMGHEVVDIERDKVLLRKDGQSFYIVFPPEE